jgi:hypothetical protein
MDHFAALPVQTPPQALLPLARAEAHVELADPASAVFTDLRVAPGVVVPTTESLEETRRLMQLAGVRMAFVVNAGEDVMGMVTLADLQGERPAQAARVRGVPPRDLTALDVMTAVGHWSTIDAAHLARAQVGHVVETLRATGQRYLVVVERIVDDAQLNRAHWVIRGLFSANRVERALGRPIAEELRSKSFAELAATLT